VDGKKLNFNSRDYRKRLLSYNKSYKKNMFSKNVWKLTSKIKNTSIRDITDNINGKFLLFKPKHHLTVISVLKSKNFLLPARLKEVCLNFYISIGHIASKRRSEKSLPKLKVYVVPKGGRTRRQNLVWTSEEMSITNSFQKITIHILKGKLLPLNKRKFRVYFEAVKEQSTKAYVAIDDVQLNHCYSGIGEREAALPVSKTSKEKNLPQLYNKSAHKIGMPASTPPNIYIQNRNFDTFQRVLESNTPYPMFRNLVTKRISSQTSSSVIKTETCNFYEYTGRVSSCLKIFFNGLDSITKVCSDLYDQLEVCVQSKAVSCIPNTKIDTKIVNKTVTDILRKNLNTKQVYCIEQGAFIYPDFSGENLPRCSGKYVEELTKCSDNIKKAFLSHQEMDLCYEYHKANECQRRIIAQECTFALEEMLKFGLKMVYQQAHNPFCAELSTSNR